MAEDFLEAAVRLDANDDFVGLSNLVSSSRVGVAPVLAALQHLLGKMRLKSAYVLAMILD
ncbi:MAG: hypothetical protein HQL88_09605, partial [Magnetococcales bacterium]|nr:hypothetical protein [Magnetococcales bacterium]